MIYILYCFAVSKTLIIHIALTHQMRKSKSLSSQTPIKQNQLKNLYSCIVIGTEKRRINSICFLVINFTQNDLLHCQGI